MSINAPAKALTLKDYKSDLHNDWCPGCVTPATRIVMGDGITRPIAEVKVGDSVLGHDGKAHRVTEVMSHWHPDTLHRISVSGRGAVTLTADHPVYITRIDPVSDPTRVICDYLNGDASGTIYGDAGDDFFDYGEGGTQASQDQKAFPCA